MSERRSPTFHKPGLTAPFQSENEPGLRASRDGARQDGLHAPARAASHRPAAAPGDGGRQTPTFGTTSGPVITGPALQRQAQERPPLLTATPDPANDSGLAASARAQGPSRPAAKPRRKTAASKKAAPGHRKESAGKGGGNGNGGSGSGSGGRRGGGKKPRRHWAVSLLRVGVVAMIWLVVFGAAAVAVVGYTIPRIDEVEAAPRQPSVTIIAGDGSTFARIGQLSGKQITLADVPPWVPNAVVAIEDKRFYYHPGVDPIGLLRAAWTNWRAGRIVQGGSTLTQQLAKNLFLTPDRTMLRKAQELVLALWLDWHYSKEELLAAYLNRVYLGGGAYGVDAAAQRYFNKDASKLNVREAAVIAGLLKAPSRYAPTNDPQAAQDRSNIVLDAMLEQHYLTRTQYDTARATPVERPTDGVGPNSGYISSWIADTVWDLAGEQDRDVVARTTLDPRIQRAAEDKVAAMMQSPATSKANVGQTALVAMAPDGSVLGMVGGTDYGESRFNRATDAHRQPGSSFKPFVYLAALEAGKIKPDSIVVDEPININGYSPSNYEPGYLGTISARTALEDSINTVAVKTLWSTGVSRTINLAHSLGLPEALRSDLSLALGSSEVTPLDLAGLYAALASGGRPVYPYIVTEIRDTQGNVLYRRHSEPAPPVVGRRAISDLTSMMTGVLTEGTGKSARLDRPAAGKTGTSQDSRDAWFAGFTSDLVAVVWMGNDDNKPMKHVTGGTLPAQLWRDFMLAATKGQPARPLPYLLPDEVEVPVASNDVGLAGSARGPAPQPEPEGGLAGFLKRLFGQ
ncbi:PBP1A family penicillin-binding protein [Radicibacter daui]|uniref:PBP1A family penicillin-binding protein n=1 Tax=Radicibacter daui TaxID=3064829 RepID=UPI0040469740